MGIFLGLFFQNFGFFCIGLWDFFRGFWDFLVIQIFLVFSASDFGIFSDFWDFFRDFGIFFLIFLGIFVTVYEDLFSCEPLVRITTRFTGTHV